MTIAKPEETVDMPSLNEKDKPLSGAGMDKKIERKKSLISRRNIVVTIFVLALASLYFAISPGAGRVFKLDGNRITIADVREGKFEDFIPVRGRVIPARTVFLDTIEGGRVEKIHVEDGASVQQGELLVELSNTALQLDVISREAQVTEQLNNLRTLELSLEQNRLNHKKTLIDIDYALIRLSRVVNRRQELSKRQGISTAELENAEDELAYNHKRRAVTIESQKSDEKLQKQQMSRLNAATVQLEKNLEFAHKNLDNLFIKAPVSGMLTAFDVEIGQSLSQGQRLGQIDDPSRFKVNAQIDEFYLGRVDVGQEAQVQVTGKEYILKVKKTSPQVRDGQFEVDFLFAGIAPNNIRRGQTLQAKLFLGDTDKAVVIPNGSFYADTGGAWVFVVNAGEDKAVRRQVHLGRRNSKVIEVIDGLDVGEKIIISPYTNFIDMDRLDLSVKN